MPKTPPKNSFYFYMKELQEEYRCKGLNYSMKQMPELATPTWKNMTTMERAPYEDEAKNAKLTHKDRIGKLDCTGQSIKENVKNIENQSQSRVKEQNYIDNVWDHLKSEDEVAKNFFYFVSTQTFGKTSDNFYIPAEIAIAKYSITEGIIEEFHSFINPREPPLGYRFEMKSTSDRTHKIPISGFDLAKDNYAEIVDGIYKVVRNRGFLDLEPVLFCYSDELKQTAFILNKLLMPEVARPLQREFKIYDITTLMCSLYGRFKSFSRGIIENEWLKCNKFSFKYSTCCKYHWDNEVSYCALGNVKSFCYVFSDHLCEMYDVDVISGRHLPNVDDSSSEFYSKDTCENPSRSTSRNTVISINSSIGSFKGICRDSKDETKTSRAACVSSSSNFSWKVPEPVFESNNSANFPNMSSLNSELENLDLQSDKVNKNKTFASATMGPSQTKFELSEDNFPDLGSSIYPSSSSIDINIPGWHSRSNSSITSQANSDITTPRVLGRGRFMKKQH